MPGGFSHDIRGLTEAGTARLAAALAPGLAVGDVLLLQGGLGAGKTHFARALIQARLAASGRREEVPSPTYTLVQTYDDGECEIWHADLYRLDGPEQAIELGLDEAFANAICLVEWPDRLHGAWPADALTVTFHMASDGAERDLVFRSGDARWADRLSRRGAATDA